MRPVIHQLTRTSVRLSLTSGGKSLAIGTGFFWKSGDATLLITAAHNLTGIHPETGEHLSPSSSVPAGLTL